MKKAPATFDPFKWPGLLKTKMRKILKQVLLKFVNKDKVIIIC